MRREHKYIESILPAGYSRLEYIESTGSQYIDTGYTNSLNYHHIITFESVGNNNQWHCGDVQSVGAYRDFGINTTSDHGIIRFAQRYNANVRGMGIGTGWHTVEVDKAGYSVDGSLVNWSSIATSAGGVGRILLFKAYGSSLAPVGKIARYAIKNYSTGVLICDFYAAIRDLDNKPGMYDIVNDVFKVNAGTGEFQYM